MQEEQMCQPGLLTENSIPPSSSSSSSWPYTCTSSMHVLLYNLSAALKEKVQQLQSILIFEPEPEPEPEPAAATAALIQDIIVTASSMMYSFQQITAAAASNSSEDDATCINAGKVEDTMRVSRSTIEDVIELDAADLLAEYAHFCQVCGKGFKRDANLRMHMRAHGDEYKTNEALTSPSKRTKKNSSSAAAPQYRYSCPQEGCRWNRKHAKFQPLKSMVCAKNHYRRSHCPKMYVCNRCNQKHFSVLSDLRTHEKHCGDRLRWQCSCGTSFSRKDKLMGHVSLFANGHAPAVVE